MRIAPNATDQSVFLTILDGEGALVPAATLNAAKTSIDVCYKAGQSGETATAPGTTALTDETDAHSDRGVFAIADGILRVDIPDAPWAAGAPYVLVWVDATAIDASYAVAGGFQRVELGYALQNPDSSTTAIARASDVLNLATVLAQISTNVSTVLSKMLIYFRLALRKDATAASQHPTELAEINNTGGSYSNLTDSVEAARDAAADAKTAAESADGKLPADASTRLGTLPTTGTVITRTEATADKAEVLDAVAEVETAVATVGGGPVITGDALAPFNIPFGRRTGSSSWYKSQRPVRVAVGETPMLVADMEAWGNPKFTAMEQPTTSSSAVASPGTDAGETYGLFLGTGTPACVITPNASATAGAKCVVTFYATAGGQRLRFDVDVEVVAGAP